MSDSEPQISVLLVEDNPGDAHLFRVILTEEDSPQFSIHLVTCLSQAFEFLRSNTPDTIVLDLGLPDGTGLECLEKMRENCPGAPVIVLTGLSDELSAVRALQKGAQDYLVKGQIDRPLLVRSIRYAIERNRAEAGLRDNEERYSLAVRATNDGLWDWNLVTDEIYFSTRWKSIVGLEEEHIENRTCEWFNRVHSEDLERLKQEIENHLAGYTPRFEMEHRIRHKDGSYRWVVSRGIAVRDASGRTIRLGGSQTDVTARKLAVERLRDDAFHDSLTGLPNRQLMMDRLGRAVKRAKRYKEYRFAVLFLDVDQFKSVNDSLGHMAGDRILIAIARCLTGAVRSTDTVSRPGGDEFAVLLEDLTDLGTAIRVAERIHEALSSPFRVEGEQVCVTVSIGIAFSETAYDYPEDVLRDADVAMYRAKALGGARHEVFKQDMDERAAGRRQIEKDLRHALKNDEFFLRYQPVMSVPTGQIAGFEALVRWSRGLLGTVGPNEFIPVAEETGLIKDLDRWVLRQACQQMRTWHEQFPERPPLTISVNISAIHFKQGSLLEYIDRVVAETKLDPRHLVLEITERAYLGDPESITAEISGLKSRGIRLHVDDFGVGYSSLSYLSRFPIDAVKIDRSFVSKLDSELENLEIVRAVAALAKSLGMGVVAEGVETAEQLAHIKDLRCDWAQGYLFAEPLAAEQAASMLADEYDLLLHACPSNQDSLCTRSSQLSAIHKALRSSATD